MELNPDWRELFESFVENNVEFLMVGAMAMAFHGTPRVTGDLDVWVRPTKENAERVIRALKAFGVGSMPLAVEDFVVPDQVVQIGYPPRRIDILTFLSGLEFENVWPKRVVLQAGDLSIPVIGLEDLVANKRATGRPKDIADLVELEGRSD